MKNDRQHYDLDYKRRIVAEYLSGTISAEALAQREGWVRGRIYKWRVQLERRDRISRIEVIAETEGVSIEQARKIRELEEEPAATQQKLSQTMREVDLLKKLQPHSPFASASSGYIDTQRRLARSRGRAT